MIIGICDDEIVIHEKVKEYISGHDFGMKLEIISFLNGQELLKYEGKIDILLLDICMPELDGIEVGQCLKRQQKTGRIIMLTSMLERF